MDGDGLTDLDEYEETKTDPTKADTDDDGLSDGVETTPEHMLVRIILELIPKKRTLIETVWLTELKPTLVNWLMRKIRELTLTIQILTVTVMLMVVKLLEELTLMMKIAKGHYHHHFYM